ncbi:MAG: phosphorylase [Nitrosomonas sp.]|nr:MAG: phosphorylase [Nitrosomonas sp.]
MSYLGIVSALKSEATCLMNLRFPVYRVVNIGDNTKLCLSSIGNDAARGAALKLCENGASALVSFGVAAALNNALTPGDLVLPEAIIQDGGSLPVDIAWRNRLAHRLSPHLTVTGGTLAAADVPLTSRQEKIALGEKTGACAADMETAAVAKVAGEIGIPFIAIRAIVDPLEFSPPDALLSAVHPDGNVDLIRLIALLIKRSVSVKTLIHLGLGMHAARTTLGKVVQVAGITFANDSLH